MNPTSPTIAIVGAGLAGTLVAAQLVRRGTPEVLLIDATGTFGPGVAYATSDELHLLNVPAARLSAFPDDPDHFLAWARTRMPEVQPGEFLQRRLYGDYVRDVLAAAEARTTEHGGSITRVTGQVVAVESRDGREQLRLVDGRVLDADHVVLALGSPARQVPDGFPNDVPVFTSPWAPGALDDIEPGTTLLIGTGLTAVDAALSVTAAHPNARVVAVSRSGLLPFEHLDGGLRTPVPAPSWPAGQLTAADLVDGYRAHVARAERDGHDWRDVVDAIRPQIPELWSRLEVEERRTLLAAHARAWEIRRHRMAPQVAARLRELEERGRFEIRVGGIGDLTPTRIISCVGPSLDVTESPDPLLQQLVTSGRAATDPLRLGLDVRSPLHLIGPLRRGELWETTAVAEIRAQAQALADELLGAPRTIPTFASSATV